MKKGLWRRTAVVLAVGLAVRVAIVWWAHERFPPIADGTFYDMFARRLARGLGYTVAWPDGAVTYAAHYPVGYPAMLAVAYTLFGARVGVAMGLNAALGTIASGCAHRVAMRELRPGSAMAAGLIVALHPALVLYTPAVMTEGVAAALLVCAVACLPTRATVAKRVYVARIVAAGVVFGLATLVRPQLLPLAPLLAWVFVPRPQRRRALAAAAVLAATLATLAPWTARNCVRMHRCALVSVNAGWNLLIGVHTENGGWTALEAPPAGSAAGGTARIPEECRTVWDEAQKDVCFERAARREIDEAPRPWLAKVPRKLAMTFDVIAAGPWYLHHANESAFGKRAELAWGAVETLAERLLLALAFVATAPIFRVFVRQKRWRATAPRLALAAAGVALSFTRSAWIAYALLAALCAVRGRGERASPLRLSAAIVLGATIATHAVFFGAGRYALLVLPSVALAAFACVRPKALSASLPSASGR